MHCTILLLVALLFVTVLACAPVPLALNRTQPKEGETYTQVPSLPLPTPNISVPPETLEPPANASASDSTRGAPANGSAPALRAEGTEKHNATPPAAVPPALMPLGLVEFYLGFEGKLWRDEIYEGETRTYVGPAHNVSVTAVLIGDSRAKMRVDGVDFPILGQYEDHTEDGVYLRVQKVMGR
jgi:hypothetical protein